MLAAAGGFAFVHLLRQHGRLLLKLDRIEQVLADAGLSTEADEPMPEIGLPPGSTAPGFATRALDGAGVTLEALLEPGRSLLLLFTSPSCGPCRTLMPSVARWQRIHESVLTIAVASSGKDAEIRAEAEEHSIGNVLLDDDHTLYSAYEANGTPSAVLIGADGRIASWMASGAEWVERLVADALAGDARAGAAGYRSAIRRRRSSSRPSTARRRRSGTLFAARRSCSSGTHSAASAARCIRI